MTDILTELKGQADYDRKHNPPGDVLLDRAINEIKMLREYVIAFAAPNAAHYAHDFGLPNGHLHPHHYDILAHCGARMDDFTRAEI